MVISAFAVIMLYAFFAFTEIGDGNALIRRMRTAFRPQEDTSFNVRIENQKLIAEITSVAINGKIADSGG